ncbi:MAG: glycosyltransferase [Luteitalea sp.]|nr:glycosyltransferase [Luteitalea sp.]
MEPGVDHQCSPDRFRVSLLLVNYKTYTELTACLHSLEDFVTGDLEVIVVDHATEPAGAAAVVQRFPWIHLIGIDENPGFASGVNRAAQVAAGRYFLLLNPDCVVSADVAGALADWLDEHPHVGACGALVRESNGTIQASARRFPDVTTGLGGRTSWLTRAWPTNLLTRRNLGPGAGATAPTEVDWVTGACMMVRRDGFDAVGGMDEKFFMYWEDADLCFRLKRAGWPTVYNPMVEVTHLTGRSSTYVPRESLIAFHRSAFRYFNKHSGRGARLLVPLVYLALQARLLAQLVSLRLSRPA